MEKEEKMQACTEIHMKDAGPDSDKESHDTPGTKSTRTGESASDGGPQES